MSGPRHPGALVVARAAELARAGHPIGPDPATCRCGAARWEHNGAAWGGRCARTGCGKYRLDEATRIASAAAEHIFDTVHADLARYEQEQRARRARRAPQARRGWSVRFSDVGECPRRIYYRNLPPDDLYTNITDGRAARTGTVLHDGVAARRRALYPWREYDMPVTLPGLDGHGLVDEYDPVTGVLRDLKTLGEWKWEQYGVHGVAVDALEQTLLYALAVERAGAVVTAVVIDAFRRANGESEALSYPWDDHARAAARAVYSRLIEYASALDVGAELPRGRSGPSTDPICARFCQFRDYCWNLPAATARGRSPESYTHLGPDPADEAVEAAIRAHIGAKAARAEAERAAKEASTVLEGIPAGSYGDHRITMVRKSSPDHKAHAALLLDLIGTPVQDLPDPGTWEHPPTRAVSYLTTGRRRASQRAAPPIPAPLAAAGKKP